MNEKSINIGLAGDVMIGRFVDEVISRNDYNYAWGDMLPVLRKTDTNIINLETTLTTSKKIVNKTFNFKASPDKIKTLTEAHITGVNLANNHILDFSEEGLKETINTLDSAGIQHTGAGMNETEAAKPIIFSCKEIYIGVIGFTDNEPGWKAGPSKSGINYINVLDRSDCKKAFASIQQLKNNSDITIVSIHWGPNMKEKPDPAFIEFAHGMIDSGADIIHGHSAHIFQGIEIYKNKPILYDTGDFVDDYLVNTLFRNDHSLFYLVEITKHAILSLQVLPVFISECQVNRATGSDSSWSLHRLQKLSSEFGTTINDAGEVSLKKEQTLNF